MDSKKASNVGDMLEAKSIKQLSSDTSFDQKQSEVNDIAKHTELCANENDNKRLTVTYAKNEDQEVTNECVKFVGFGEKDSICSSKSSENSDPQIPDGGWGWVVVVASFMIAAIADGVAFSYGLINNEFVDFFHASEAKTSLIGSLFLSVPLIAGPIMSALVDRYGCRSMTIVGGIISTVGFIAGAFSNSIEVLCVTFGLIAGSGMGLLYVTAVVSIAYWFDKRRNLAVGLGSCGVGFGTFVYSPLTTYLLNEFGWRGTLIILAGTVLNVCICGAVMRDPEWLILEQKKQRSLSKHKRTPSTLSISAKSAKSGGGEAGLEELKNLIESGKSPEYILKTLISSIAKAEDLEVATKSNADLSQNKVSSVINFPTFLRQNEKLPDEVLEQLLSNKRLYNMILQRYPSLLELNTSPEHKISIDVSGESNRNKQSTTALKCKLSKEKTDDENKMEKIKENLLKPIPENKTTNVVNSEGHDWITKHFSDHNYLKDIRVHRNTIMHRGAMMTTAKYKLRASSCPNIYKNSMWSIDEDVEETWCRRIIRVLNKTFDFNMFTEFHFMTMNVSTLIFFVWFIVPFFYISPFMVQTGYSESDSSIIISVFGIATIIGIAFLGWIGDFPWVNITKTYAFCLVLCGVNIALFPVIIRHTDPSAPYSFYILAANSVVFGLSFSSNYSYTPSILVELIALERFTMAYGLILLSQGIGHLVGPPIAGALKDITGYWDTAFYIAGVWVILSGLLVVVIPYTKNFRICGNAPLAKDVAAEIDSGIRIVIH